MTVKELRNKMIIFLTDDWCSARCKLLEYGPLIDSAILSNYVCRLDQTKNLGRTASHIVLGCQKCKDLFSQVGD